jgi:hypothetical protein
MENRIPQLKRNLPRSPFNWRPGRETDCDFVDSIDSIQHPDTTEASNDRFHSIPYRHHFSRYTVLTAADENELKLFLTNVCVIAARLTGVMEKTALVRMGLESLIATESSKRLSRLGGTEKSLRPIRRRRS